ncbi:MAG: hypothetical protein ABF542_11805 [Gluconobacter sp.]
MAGFNTNALMPTPLAQQTNPLEFASQAIGVRNALLGNKIQQAKYDADMAQGNALLGATGADGRTDYAKARAAMAADPAAAYGAAQAVREQNVARADDLAHTEAGKTRSGPSCPMLGQTRIRRTSSQRSAWAKRFSPARTLTLSLIRSRN